MATGTDEEVIQERRGRGRPPGKTYTEQLRVRLEPDDREALGVIMEREGLSNESKAVRRAVRQWAALLKGRAE